MSETAPVPSSAPQPMPAGVESLHRSMRQLILAGAAIVILFIGAEAIVTPGGMKAWEMLRVLSPQLCRPFSRGRNGLLLGEGSSALVIEA